MDFDWLLGTLKDRGYTGHFSIEYLQDKDVDYRQTRGDWRIE